MPSTLDGSRDQDQRIVETMRPDVQVPVIKAGEGLGTNIKQFSDVSQDEPKDRVSGREPLPESPCWPLLPTRACKSPLRTQCYGVFQLFVCSLFRGFSTSVAPT